MDLNDLDKAKPAQLKANRITNIPDYKLTHEGIDGMHVKKLQVKKPRNPLEPSYTVETRSRRMVTLGGIDGNKPLHCKTTEVVKNRGDEEKTGGKVLWPSQSSPTGSPSMLKPPKASKLRASHSSKDYSLQKMKPEVNN